MKQVILASNSPRRKELMTLLPVSFVVKTEEVEEIINNSLTPSENVCLLSEKKACAVSEKHKDDWVIGCDTVVVYKEKILGKPKDVGEARDMLNLLSGNTHEVYTGVTLINSSRKIKKSFYVCSLVKMKPLAEWEIESYIATKEPMDKAGSYAIQGNGAVFIESIQGDYFNIVGLPISKLYDVLKELEIVKEKE